MCKTIIGAGISKFIIIFIIKTRGNISGQCTSQSDPAEECEGQVDSAGEDP
jgi:hypothetical protein